MARCFCGCGRRVLVKGSVANVYGENGDKLAANVRALLELEDFKDQAEARLRELLLELKRLRSTYMDAVHGDARLPRAIYEKWMLYRDQALTVVSSAQQHTQADPNERAVAALGQWAVDQGLTDEQTAEAMLTMEPAELERIASDYKRSAHQKRPAGPGRVGHPAARLRARSPAPVASAGR